MKSHTLKHKRASTPARMVGSEWRASLTKYCAGGSSLGDEEECVHEKTAMIASTDKTDYFQFLPSGSCSDRGSHKEDCLI
jgi:hypothetical protein